MDFSYRRFQGQIYRVIQFDLPFHFYIFLSEGMTNQEVLTQVERGYRMPQPINSNKAVYEVMLTCWSQDPEQRPTFEYLFNFFDDFYVASGPSYGDADRFSWRCSGFDYSRSLCFLLDSLSRSLIQLFTLLDFATVEDDLIRVLWCLIEIGETN